MRALGARILAHGEVAIDRAELAELRDKAHANDCYVLASRAMRSRLAELQLEPLTDWRRGYLAAMHDFGELVIEASKPGRHR